MMLPFMLVLLSAVQCAVVPLERRQASFETKERVRNAVRIEELPPRTGIAGTRRLQLTYGPFKIRGLKDTTEFPEQYGSMDKSGTAYTYIPGDEFPRNITILRSSSNLLNDKFQIAKLSDGIYTHHNAFLEFVPKGDQIFKCASGVVRPVDPVYFLAGAGSEKVDMRFYSPSNAFKSGYYLSEKALLKNMLDVVNNGPDTRDAYSMADVEFLPGPMAGYLNAKQILVNPDFCGGQNGSFFMPPAGEARFHVDSKGIILAENGYIVRQFGHLHDGGTDVTMYINDKEVCKSQARYGGPDSTTVDASGRVWESINSFSECNDSIYVREGDRLQIVANYDRELHPPRKSHDGVSTGMGSNDAEQMALMIVYFAKAATPA